MKENRAQPIAENEIRTWPAGSWLTTGIQSNIAILTLNEDGIVCDCNPASESLFKYDHNELVSQHVSMLLPVLATLSLMQNGQLNSRLRFLSRIGYRFLSISQDRQSFSSQLFFNHLDETARLSLLVRPAVDAFSEQIL